MPRISPSFPPFLPASPRRGFLADLAEGASLAFAGESTLKFDASSLSANALFTAEGKKGKLTAADAKVNVEASNLSWGRYYLFENFDTEGVTKENFVTADGKLVAADKWSEQLKAPSMGIELEVDEKAWVPTRSKAPACT